MTADATLVIAWLVLAHLVADFVLQTDGIVAAKTGTGSRALVGLLQHGAGVGIVLAPLVVAFGPPGLAAAVLIAVGHLVVDRTKIVLTRRVEDGALADAARRHESGAPAVAGLDRAWTSLPAALFVLDQAAHLGLIVLAWAIWLDGAPLTAAWADAVGRLVGQWPGPDVHRVALWTTVGLSLLIVNVRAASLLVSILVNPRSAVEPGAGDLPAPGAGSELEPDGGSDRAAPDDPADDPADPPPAPPAGPPADPFGTASADPPAGSAESSAPRANADRLPAASLPIRRAGTTAPPARIGEAIGILERLVVVALVLTGSTAAIGFVIAAKTLARFRQLDDRAFAEYYLLGTLASVTIALLSGLAAAAVLA